MDVPTLNLTILTKDVFVVLIILSATFLALFSWLSIGKTRLLNRLVKTPLAPFILIIAILFFVLAIGTLISTLTVWIIPLHSLIQT
ncbi:hypothetical protein GW793_01425 [bacterium]|uniref:ABC transporter permease n=2 Tax=Katanobacteria TaxID=422282 RepID=A0A2M7X340_UNCKA|nr:hypothetical protein [bacterium]PIP56922.1 MAG: hypothetical protein COX05_00575 [candidate division WWE3 bacterium CG22_combo_CG10-13_8_21_14_all_39_12]PJA40548.1 MAG: hypothetical protein CO179_01870 [candidate division WWE3 bacterium CG_4_9_14_3_um_filter_39_7]